MKMAEKQAELMQEINNAVLIERLRQNELYGYQRRPWGEWLAILGEEFGEVCEALQFLLGINTTKETDSDNAFEELMHLAAVASAMAEQLKEEKEQKG